MSIHDTITQNYSGTTPQGIDWTVKLEVGELSSTGVVIRSGIIGDLVQDHLSLCAPIATRARDFARAIAGHAMVVDRVEFVTVTLRAHQTEVSAEAWCCSDDDEKTEAAESKADEFAALDTPPLVMQRAASLLGWPIEALDPATHSAAERARAAELQRLSAATKQFVNDLFDDQKSPEEIAARHLMRRLNEKTRPEIRRRSLDTDIHPGDRVVSVDGPAEGGVGTIRWRDRAFVTVTFDPETLPADMRKAASFGHVVPVFVLERAAEMSVSTDTADNPDADPIDIHQFFKPTTGVRYPIRFPQDGLVFG